MKNRLITIAIVFVFSMITISAAFAQGPGNRPRRGKRGQPGRMFAAHMIEMVENLDLTEEQTLTILPRLKKIKENMRALMQSNMDLLQQLNDELDKEKPDKKKLADIIEKIKSGRQEHFKLMQEEEKMLEAELTIEQIAKYYLVIHRFANRMMKREMDDLPQPPPPDAGFDGPGPRPGPRSGVTPGFRPDGTRNR